MASTKVPVERKCPKCGAVEWGLKSLDWGGPVVAACKCGEDRPVKEIGEVTPIVGYCWACPREIRKGQAVVKGTGGDTPLGGLAHPACVWKPVNDLGEPCDCVCCSGICDEYQKVRHHMAPFTEYA